MTTRLDLPEGGWAIVTEPRKVKERKRRVWLAASAEVGDLNTAEGMDKNSDALMQLVLCLVEQWSFGDVTATVFEDLDVGTTDDLVRQCMPLAADLAPNFGPDPDPKATTGESTSPLPGSPVTPP